MFTTLALLASLTTPKAIVLHAKEKGLYELNYSIPQFPSDTPVHKTINALMLKKAQEMRAEFVKNAQEFKASGMKPVAEWESEIGPTVCLDRPGLTSVYLSVYDYSGGAHPNHFTIKFNVGLVDGKPKLLTLKDIVKAPFTPDQVIDTYVLPIIQKARVGRGMTDETEIHKDNYNDFVITPAGITWLFDPYGVGAYVEGDYTAKILWRSFGSQNPFRPWVTGK